MTHEFLLVDQAEIVREPPGIAHVLVPAVLLHEGLMVEELMTIDAPDILSSRVLTNDGRLNGAGP